MSEIEPNPPVLVHPEPREVLDGHDRLTVVMNVHYEHRGDSPVQVRCTFSELCGDKEQPYTRRFKVGAEPTGLDLGWLKGKSGYILIQNMEGMHLSVHPSAEEKESIATRIIYAQLDDTAPAMDIPPGKFLLLRTRDPITLQCLVGAAQCKIHVFPE